MEGKERSAYDAVAEDTFLLRTLYLRREYSALTSAITDVDPASSTSSSLYRHAILLPPYNITSVSKGLDSEDEESRRRLCAAPWVGFLSIADDTSPWHGGCFPFSVIFPARYPYDCPEVQLLGRFSSHPLLQKPAPPKPAPAPPKSAPAAPPPMAMTMGDPLSNSPAPLPPIPELNFSRVTVSPEAAPVQPVELQNCYNTLDPLVTSVMAAVLHHLYALFSPQMWTPAFLQRVGSTLGDRERVLDAVDMSAAASEVETCSVAQEGMRERSYGDYLVGDELKEFLMRQWETRRNSTAAVPQGSGGVEAALQQSEGREFAKWLCRECLPHVSQLP